MFANAHYQISLLTAKADAVGSGIQLYNAQKFVGLIPDPHGTVSAAWRKQPHLGAAGKSRDVIHMVQITIMIKPLWREIDKCSMLIWWKKITSLFWFTNVFRNENEIRLHKKLLVNCNDS